MADVIDIRNTELPDNYRFSGFNIPMLQLDETGDAYYYIARPNIYFSHQPAYYQKPMGYGATPPAPISVNTTVPISDPAPRFVQKKDGLYPLKT